MKNIEKLADEVMDVHADLDRAERDHHRAYVAGDLERAEDFLREINRLDGIIFDLNLQIDNLGGL